MFQLRWASGWPMSLLLLLPVATPVRIVFDCGGWGLAILSVQRGALLVGYYGLVNIACWPGLLNELFVVMGAWRGVAWRSAVHFALQVE